MNHLYTAGTVRNYYPVKQYFILTSYHDPTFQWPLFIAEEAPNLNDAFLLPTHVPTSVANVFTKMNKIVKICRDDLSRSLYTSLVQKHSIAQLNFNISKLKKITKQVLSSYHQFSWRNKQSSS